MKVTISILTYIVSFALLFLILSLFGLLWGSYSEAISNVQWFIVYTILIGSWVPAFPAIEVYEHLGGS